MASTLNSDNGVVSGSAGLKSSADSSGVLALQTNGTTAVTVDTSQNVGVGTSSPGKKFVVSNAGVIGLEFSPDDASSGTSRIFAYNRSTAVYTPLRLQGSEIYFGDATERMRLDTSGNLGLGVTPSAWLSSWKALQVGNTASLVWGNDNSSVTVGTNYFFNSTADNKYIASNFATKYQQLSGVHSWHTAASGTAGATFTFTQAMTLDASGRLLLGPTSGTGMSANDLGMVNGGSIRFRNAANSAWLNMINVDSSNNLNFGVGGVPTTITFGIGGVGEVGRFDSSGNLLVGTGGATPSASVAGVRIGVPGNNYWLSSSSGTGSYAHMQFYNANGGVGSISISGSSTSYVTSSDYRLKDNPQPLRNALDTVAQLKPCTYTWKSDGSTGQGFIAHELQEVVPDCVVGEKDAVDEDGNPKYQGIDTSFLVATLTAAIQEQQALITSQSELITSLTERITALENK